MTGNHSRTPGFPVGDGVHPVPISAVLSDPVPRFEKTTNGSWRSIPAFSPTYIFSLSPFSSNHFVIAVTLNFPNRSPIRTHALVDCGATTSCISNSFAVRHSLSRKNKDIPIPVMAVDNRPIASGLITQEVMTQVSVGTHNEFFGSLRYLWCG